MNDSFSSDYKSSLINNASKTAEAGVLPTHKVREPFEADRKDSIFALTAYVLGFFFARWVMFSSWQGWGVTIFTIGYCFAVTMYILKKGVRIPRTGYFWLVVVLLTGISYSIYANKGLEPWRDLFLFCSAVYFVICATEQQILGKTSNLLLLDGINGLFVIPFKNFGCQYKSLSAPKNLKRGLGKQLSSIALGLLLALLVAGMVFPLLMRADSGGFSKIAYGIFEYYRWVQNQFTDIIFNIILAIPISAYIFGLVSGCAHNRYSRTFKIEDLQHTADAMRILTSTTIYTALGLICGLYLVFIGSQLPYFFSAFAGQRPEGWQIYSEYARSGFFELCQIAAINLSLLILAKILCKKPKAEMKCLKIFNCLLSLLTLLLIATAFSKMALYISVYGLSIRRLLPCIFMVFLTVVFCGVIALQKWQFSIMRLSVITAALIVCSLSFLNPDGFIASYNANRYLSGTLKDFDVTVLYQSGPAGVEPALKVYAQTEDQVLKAELRTYIDEQQLQSSSILGKPMDNIQNMLNRQRISAFNE